MIKTDGLNELLAAPLRDQPGKLPAIGGFTTMRRKHTDLVVELQKALEKREEAIAKLRRADDKVRKAREAVVRSTKRMKAAQVEAGKPNTMHDDPL